MAMKRKANALNRRAKRARGGRRPRISRSLIAMPPVHRFSRMVQFNIAAGAANPAYGVATYALNGLPNFSEFTNLFDQYKISFVKLTWQLNVDPSAQAAASAVYPRLYTFNDFTDITTPTTLDEFRQRPKTRVRMLTPTRPVISTCKPAVQVEVLKTVGGVTVNAPRWKQWIPSENNDVQHLGTKYAIENFTNTNYSITLTVKYWVQCKQTK